MQFFAQASPRDAQCRFSFEIKQNPTVSSFIWSTNYTKKYEGRFWLTISNFPQSLTTFVLNLFCITFLEEVHVAKDNGILGDDVMSRTIWKATYEHY